MLPIPTMKTSSNWAIAGVALLAGLAASQDSSTLPTVDLGYEIHQAFLYNVCRASPLTSNMVG